MGEECITFIVYREWYIPIFLLIVAGLVYAWKKGLVKNIFTRKWWTDRGEIIPTPRKK